MVSVQNFTTKQLSVGLFLHQINDMIELIIYLVQKKDLSEDTVFLVFLPNVVA